MKSMFLFLGLLLLGTLALVGSPGSYEAGTDDGAAWLLTAQPVEIPTVSAPGLVFLAGLLGVGGCALSRRGRR